MKFLSYILFIFWIFSACLIGEEKWIVPDEEADKISIQMFNDDYAAEGGAIFENSCQSCHGTPGEENFTLMVPSPGDPAAKKFQQQSDGSLFYKIKNGRSVMPGFGHLYSDNEIWSIVAYIRSFNDEYEQPKPDLTGIYVPKLALEVGFDNNVDKLEVFVTDRNQPTDSALVSAFIKGSFGLLSIGNEYSDKDGYTNFNIDVNQPGDEEGYAVIVIKVSKGYGYKKIIKRLQILKPKVVTSAIEGRHLWSSDAQAPIWLKLSFFATIFGVWGVLIFVVFRLIKIKKLA